MLKQCNLLDSTVKNSSQQSRSGTFTDNMKLPIHRWYRYSAGFSAEWVENLVRHMQPKVVLDPFAGSGTTLLAAEKCNTHAYGFENHPFVARLAQAKLQWFKDTEDIYEKYLSLTSLAKRNLKDWENPPPLLQKCYSTEALRALFSLKIAFLSMRDKLDFATGEILWLAITAILRKCSHVGTAQWQYVLPNKSKANFVEPFVAFEDKIFEIIHDMKHYQQNNYRQDAQLLRHDSRKETYDLNASVDLVVTSPPYPNNYDYADATRLEMLFWGDIEKWGDLQSTVRNHIICSCSQHATGAKLKLDELLENELIKDITPELSVICNTLEEVRHNHGGKKAYHLMIAAYFIGLSQTFKVLRRMCKSGSTLCFVIGDSAPYGVYVPVDIFLGKLSVAAGFNDFSFEKLRDRNIKWKNRKHRVPLKEGRLWIKG